MSTLRNALMQAGFRPSKRFYVEDGKRIFSLGKVTIAYSSKPVPVKSNETYVREYYLGMKSSTHRATEYARTFGIRSRINTKSQVPLPQW